MAVYTTIKPVKAKQSEGLFDDNAVVLRDEQEKPSMRHSDILRKNRVASFFGMQKCVLVKQSAH